MRNEPLKAALYIRVSTDEQVEYSPTAQLKALTEYAKKNGMEVINKYVFVDEGFSGRSAEKRPAFQQMIAIAKTKPKPFDVILIHKFDRFARNREDSIVYKSMLKKQCKVRVISITESLDEEDKMSGLIEAILEAMAEYYSINLAEEVKKGMTEKAHQGGFQTSPPFGYKIGENNTLQIVEEEATYVRYIFTQFAIHNKGKSQITRQLANIGVKSKRGNPIDIRNIDYILQNPVYIGKVRWTPTEKVRRNFNHPDTIVANGQHEPIISNELFQKAAEKIATKASITKARKRPIEECKHWLSGLVKCSNCGSSLTSSGMRNPCPSLQCKGYSSAICNVSHSISIKKIEGAILEELEEALSYCDKSDFELNETHVDDYHDKIAILKKQLNKLEVHLLRANEAYLSEIDTLEEYKKNKANIENQQKELSEEIKRLINSQPILAETRPKGKFQDVVDILNSDCNMRLKQNSIRSIVNKIVYDRPSYNIEVYYKDM